MRLLLIAIFTKSWFVYYLLPSKLSPGRAAHSNNIYVRRAELPEPASVETARKTTNETNTIEIRSTWSPSHLVVAMMENQAVL